MLFWLVISAVLFGLAHKINQCTWFYADQVAGFMFPMSMAPLLFAGHGLIFMEEPGFQALGLLCTVLAFLFMMTGLLIAIATVVEMIFDFVSDIVRGKDE